MKKHRGPAEFYDSNFHSDWNEERKEKILEGALRGNRRTVKIQKANRAASVPDDSVIELEARYLKAKLARRAWTSSKRTASFLKLCRDANLSCDEIARALNKEFNTTKFTRLGVISRLRFLKGLALMKGEPWRYKSSGLQAERSEA